MKIAIKFYISKLLQVLNCLEPISAKKVCLVEYGKTEHRHHNLHVQVTLGNKISA